MKFTMYGVSRNGEHVAAPVMSMELAEREVARMESDDVRMQHQGWIEDATVFEYRIVRVSATLSKSGKISYVW